MRKLILVAGILAVGTVVLLMVLSTTPTLNLPDSITAVGQATPVAVQVQNPHGIRELTAFVEQNGIEYEVFHHAEPARRFVWRGTMPEKSWEFSVGVKTTPQLKEGPARLVVKATSNDFRGRTTQIAREITVVTRPPTLSVSPDQHYLYRGMAELVTFDVAGQWNQAGVRAGAYKFRSWPMPAGKPGFFSLFAFPWDMTPDVQPVVYASGPGTDEVTGAITVRFPAKEQPRYRVRDLQLDDRFLEKVTTELDPSGSGDRITRFLRINNEMRRANNKTLADLRLKTEARFLWSQPFLQQPNSKVEANFADVRNYFYQGKKVDEQVHLGYDLAITKNVGVVSANDGRVVWAAPLGIYGNCVVVDHGYGLQSIYGHLSRITVQEGAMVQRGQILGNSGETGLAGGDHIHFSMQLDGVQIDPKSWWDSHWIEDHISKRVELPRS